MNKFLGYLGVILVLIPVAVTFLVFVGALATWLVGAVFNRYGDIAGYSFVILMVVFSVGTILVLLFGDDI